MNVLKEIYISVEGRQSCPFPSNRIDEAEDC